MTSANSTATPSPVVIHFAHAAATPHNNYLLDAVASVPGVELHRHYVFGPKRVPGRPWTKMDSGAVQADLIRVEIGNWFDPTLFKLALFDRRSSFFVIGWDYPVLVWLLILLGVLKRPLIMWDDGPSPESLDHFRKNRWSPRQLMKRFLIALINRTDGAYFCSGRHAMADIAELGVRQEKLINLPFFVKAGAHDPALRAAHGVDAAQKLIVAGGRMVPEKGYDLFVEAIAQLKISVPTGWKAVLIGSGPQGDAVQKLAQDLGLDNVLDFVAWAEPDMFASYVHSCDIFVAPARFDHFPTTVIAAMQAGAAVVATDAVGSAVEFIEPGRSGEIVAAGDVAALADAMARLIADPAYLDRVRAAGQQVMAAWPVERGAQMIIEAAKDARQCAG